MPQEPHEQIVTVQADISVAAHEHVKRVAAEEYRSVRKQLSKIIEDWHDATTQRPSRKN